MPGYEFLGGLTAAQAAFRDECRTWLAEQLDGPFADIRGSRAAVTDGEWARAVEWEQAMAAAGWRGIAWPAAVGGRGGDLTDDLIFELEYARLAGPYRPSVQGERLFGPAVLRLGAPAIERRFLRPILQSIEFWCQGFSEPDAGSDLAAVRSRATHDGAGWIIEGHKTWTTGAHHADWMYALVRTDAASERHRGLSMLLIPLDQPAVEVRPIRNMAGNVEFCDVYLDGARTAPDMVLGEPGRGWDVAMTVLAVERGITMLAMQLAFRRELDAVMRDGVAATRTTPHREALTRRWAELRILEWLTFGMLAAEGRHDRPRSASITKLLAARWEQAMGVTAIDVLGAAGGVHTASGRHRFFLDGRAATIYGGSDEVQRNILAERTLGLPR